MAPGVNLQTRPLLHALSLCVQLFKNHANSMHFLNACTPCTTRACDVEACMHMTLYVQQNPPIVQKPPIVQNSPIVRSNTTSESYMAYPYCTTVCMTRAVGTTRLPPCMVRRRAHIRSRLPSRTYRLYQFGDVYKRRARLRTHSRLRSCPPPPHPPPHLSPAIAPCELRNKFVARAHSNSEDSSPKSNPQPY